MLGIASSIPAGGNLFFAQTQGNLLSSDKVGNTIIAFFEIIPATFIPKETLFNTYSRFSGVSSWSLCSFLHKFVPIPVTVTLTFSSPSFTFETSHDSLMRSQSTFAPDSRGILTRYIRARPSLIACKKSKHQLLVADPKFSRRGIPTPKVRAPTYYLDIFFPKKMHENERNWAQRGRASLATHHY